MANITANKLVEYSQATATRRTRILEDIIEPKEFLLDTRYNEIERAFRSHACTLGEGSTALDALDKVLLNRKPKSSHDEQRLLTAHDAIEHAQSLDFGILPPDAIVSPFDDRLPKLVINGVHVSVRPTNLVVQKPHTEHTDTKIGCIKPYLGKTNNLTLETGKLYATLLQMFLDKHFSHLGKTDPSMCVVFDVFKEKSFVGNKSGFRRKKLLQNCCEEISDRWESITKRVEAKTKSRKSA